MKIFETIKSAISVAVAAVIAFLGLGLPAKDSKAPAEGMTRIMSFNVRYGEFERRKDIVPAFIEEYSPDSAGLQECTYKWYVTLTEELEDYAFVGVGRDTGTLDEDCGEISAVIYKKDKYNLIDSGTFWLSETPDEVSRGWDGACNRICTWAVLEEKQTGVRYAHVNTHLDHLGNEARTKGVELVKEKAFSFDIPTVVTGDFNFEKNNDLYKSLVTGGLTDTQDMTEDTMTGKTYHGYFGGTRGEPIDFVLVNSKITEVSSYRIVRDRINLKLISDHYPVYSDMIIK